MDSNAYEYNPRQLVHQVGKVKLYHYTPQVTSSKSTPLLVVFATVNRPEILDLFPDKSLIGRLLKQHSDVYLLDWGYPTENDKPLAFEDYVTVYLHKMVAHILKKSRQTQLDLLGVCQGGLICLCYAALAKTIRRLILISTPVNFHTRDNVIASLVRKLDVDGLTKSGNVVSGQWLKWFFQSLRPFDVLRPRKSPRMEQWLKDSPDQPAEAFGTLLKDFYQDNKLVKGELSINGQSIHLKSVTVPILNIIASDDVIVPASASRALKRHVGSTDYSLKTVSGGHIGIYLSQTTVASLTDAIIHWL